jgi:hypothetical protein
MESVEAATGAIPQPVPEEAEEAARPTAEPDGRDGEAARRGRRQAAATAAEEEAGESVPAAAPTADPWSGLLQVGMALLQQLATAGGDSRGATGPGGGAAAGKAQVIQDERTGERYLKLPVPPPEVLDQALRAFGTLLESLRR